MNYKQKIKLKPKPLFEQRMKKLLSNLEDYNNWLSISYENSLPSIRCNTLKISPEELKIRLEKKSWKIIQPFKDYPEIMIILNKLQPGELGNSLEHLLGYYYIQEISSTLPIFALSPSTQEIILDLCAAPGSKTTQLAAKMENQGTIIANDQNLSRIKILSSNLQRCGVTNCIVTRNDGVQLCLKLKKAGFQFDKILVDAPCSGEGTLRDSPKTFLMWNLKMINKLSRIQKKLAETALSILKPGGEMIYSTCTHSPEENELVLNYLLENYYIKLIPFKLPLKTRPGITNWESKNLSQQIKLAHRIYPQDNNTEGFFLAKIKKLKQGRKLS